MSMENQQTTITKLIDDETYFIAAGDTINWAKCWLQTEEAQFTFTSARGMWQYTGWDSIKANFRNPEPFKLNLKRDNYHYTIGDKVAFVSFDQYDNWGGTEGQKKKESRTLRKVDDQWKIVNVNVIDYSSYDNLKERAQAQSVSYHGPIENLPVDKRTSFRNKGGLGGMSAAFMEVPAGTDFAPFLEGLPQDMCPAPHWGYLLEGAIQLKYADGRVETINKGEIFYWPAPHTGKVLKDAKFIEFSPEEEYQQVMTHISNKMAQQKKK
ncbi:hypothetical protein EFB08_16550 [Rufibacter latericius]|uniref:DUF4440 domain-containing protein n=2 Tax=Rufibacter latericius TaxID=2487040 RepID=A0A3M9MGA9_9BACT|nr:hypothetical protein EFB08_16550 [Rufibacter latericius]